MIALLQRVSQARVDIAGETVGQIGHGLLVLVCAEPEDTEATGQKLLAKILKLRIFSDEQGKMNRSVQDVAGGLLIVSQFTLAADTKGGNRPGFHCVGHQDQKLLAAKPNQQISSPVDYYGPVSLYLANIEELEKNLEEKNPTLLAWFRKSRGDAPPLA